MRARDRAARGIGQGGNKTVGRAVVVVPVTAQDQGGHRDRVAARLLLGTMEDTPPSALAAITMPTLVLCGDRDNDNGSADSLVAALPNATRGTIPGTHMSCVTLPDLGAALVEFLM